MQNKISPVLALALSKIRLPDDYRSALEPGSYKVSATVQLDAEIRIGEDYEQRIHHAVPWMDLLALALSKLNGVSVESLVRDFCNAQAAGEAIAPDGFKESAADALHRIKGAIPPRTCNGKVTGSTAVSRVVRLSMESDCGELAESKA